MLKSIVNPIVQCIRSKGMKMLLNDYSTNASSYVVHKSFHPFRKMVELRRTQANNSVLIQMNTANTVNSVLKMCSIHGAIKFASLLSGSKGKPVLLVEYNDHHAIRLLMEQVNAVSTGIYKNMNLPYLYYDMKNDIRKGDLSTSHSTSVTQFSSNPVGKMLWSCTQNFSEEISHFYDAMKLTEIGWRLRFLACRKVELLLPAFITPCQVLPFGSSINSFGRYDCDVDMNICTNSQLLVKCDGRKFKGNNQLHHMPTGQQENSIRDITSQKKIKGDIVKVLSRISISMRKDSHRPSFKQVKCIFHARVPIIKCNESFTNIHCDITASNMDGCYMSEILYTFGCYDSRVRPLVFYIRKWAKETDLSKEILQGRRIMSNFTITCLVLYYLMRTSPPVIPSIMQLEKLLGKSSKPDFTFPPATNHENLAELFGNFFKYYAHFQYNKYSISLLNGEPLKKECNYPLILENPIDTGHNVTQNIGAEDLDTFSTLCSDTWRIIVNSRNILEEKTNGDCRLSYIINKLGIASKAHPSQKIGNSLTYEKLMNQENVTSTRK